MGKIRATIIDSETGGTIDAKAQVIDSSGHYIHPKKAIQKVGPGQPFFYTDGMFEVDVTRGNTRITVERGTAYTPKTIYLDSSAKNIKSIEIELSRLNDLQEQGWHPGNTHIHYDEKQNRPDERLHLDPRVENLRMTAVSVLKRWDLNYSTNKYPIGFLNDFSSDHHYVQNGEESRHNQKPWEIGYGHIMLLDIRNAVDPMSRGLLVDAFEPDYPPLSYACDKAHQQGGTVIWCHNGQGMEAPVAAALGKIDAFNLFDTQWMDPEYEIYYRVLNTGINLPASTGSDWFISSANRVYANTGGAFDYEAWLTALKAGNTFITNGPALELSVGDETVGGEIYTNPGSNLSVQATWDSHYPINRVEIIFNGQVVAAESHPDGSKMGVFSKDITSCTDGWIAARLFSNARDSFAQPIWAHTSPIYVKTGAEAIEKKQAAVWFDEHIEKSLEWVTKKGKFYTDSQRKEVVDLFRQGQQVYKAML